MRQGLTHGDGWAISDPSIGGGAEGFVEERDAREGFGVGPGVSGDVDLLEDLFGARHVDGLVVGDNNRHYLHHDGH